VQVGAEQHLAGCGAGQLAEQRDSLPRWAGSIRAAANAGAYCTAQARHRPLRISACHNPPPSAARTASQNGSLAESGKDKHSNSAIDDEPPYGIEP
jgi:hypothetical protein